MSAIMPDYLAAIRKFLEDQPGLSSREIIIRPMGAVDDLVSSDDPNPHARNMITITGIPGFGLHQGLIMTPRFEIRSWGTNGYEAMLGWRIAHTALVPSDPGAHSGFTRYGCHIYSLAMVNSPITLVDLTGWESRSAFYSAMVREIPL